MKNYTKTNIGNEGRTELHEVLELTGAEVSINRLPAGAGVPFVHSHKNNEEIYEQLIEKCESQPVPIPYFSTTEFAEVFINQCATVRTSPGLSRDLSRQHSYE